ncbi:response regulator [Leptospira idonii]|uniref:Response regulator n=1 Tax=Leptospira idonii TaxID=1193500 RepID=A0A4R9LXW8_9LEPT|nr:response regulator [Leptospira idonii]TGN19184.1 response regulator [Leptospira idonii]
MAKILIVDDAPIVLKILRLVLSTEGHEVDAAANGKEALLKLESNVYNIAIFDVNMPDISGIELTKKALSSPNGKNLKVVILSTETSPEMRDKGKDAGAIGWLHKPFENEALINLIQSLL